MKYFPLLAAAFSLAACDNTPSTPPPAPDVTNASVRGDLPEDCKQGEPCETKPE